MFPQMKDTPDGANHRKNLITVPSCDAHNSEKSHDDEYLLFALAGSYTSSEVGLNQFLTKVRRAFEKRPSKAANFVRTSAPVQLRRVEGEAWEDGVQVIIDGDRIDGVLSNCARALYYHHTCSKFQGSVQVLTNFTMYMDKHVQASVSEAFDIIARTMADEPLMGENPDVFSYKFKETDTMAILYFCFYKSSAALARFKKIVIVR